MGQIYCIRNKINNLCYVGMTTSSFYYRYGVYNKHWYVKHCNPLLYRDTKRFLESDFEISILYDNQDIPKDELYDLEEFWILHLNTLHPNGYNLSLPRRKLYLKQKRPEINCSNGKTYKNCFEAGVDLNIDPNSISKCLRGERKHTSGMTFVFSPNVPPQMTIELYKDGTRYNSAVIEILCSNGQSYRSARQAAKILGISSTSITRCLRKELDYTNGLSFSYFPEKPLKTPEVLPIYCCNGKMYTSVESAALDNDLTIKEVNRSLCRESAIRSKITFSYKGFPKKVLINNISKPVITSCGLSFKSTGEAARALHLTEKTVRDSASGIPGNYKYNFSYLKRV